MDYKRGHWLCRRCFYFVCLFAFASRTPSSAGDDDDEGATTREKYPLQPPSLLFRCNRCGAMDWSNRDCMQERRGDLSKQIQSKTGNGIISERDWKLVVLLLRTAIDNTGELKIFQLVLPSYCHRIVLDSTRALHTTFSLSLSQHTHFSLPNSFVLFSVLFLFFFSKISFVPYGSGIWERIRARLPNFRSLSLFNEYVACCSVGVVVVLASLPACLPFSRTPRSPHKTQHKRT